MALKKGNHVNDHRTSTSSHAQLSDLSLSQLILIKQITQALYGRSQLI